MPLLYNRGQHILTIGII